MATVLANGRREPGCVRVPEPDRRSDLEVIELVPNDHDHGRFDPELLSNRGEQHLEGRFETIGMRERPSTSNKDLAFGSVGHVDSLLCGTCPARLINPSDRVPAPPS